MGSITETVTEAETVTVPTHLNYYITPEKGGVSSWYPGTASNFTRKQDVRPVEIIDIRSATEKITLDTHGFELVKHKSNQKDFDESDPDALKATYWHETADLVKNVTGASHVHPISHFMRKMSWKDAKEESQKLDPLTPLRQPATGAYCHVDQSYDGAIETLKDNLEEAEATRLSQTRWALINVWRPIKTIHREPLAMCDARSVDEEDLHAVRLHILPQGIYSNMTACKSFEAWAVTYNEEHKWYYASEMQPDEVIFIKIFDSKKDGRARRCPHSAFNLPNESGPPRKSIEMRFLVFWEDEACT